MACPARFLVPAFAALCQLPLFCRVLGHYTDCASCQSTFQQANLLIECQRAVVTVFRATSCKIECVLSAQGGCRKLAKLRLWGTRYDADTESLWASYEVCCCRDVCLHAAGSHSGHKLNLTRAWCCLQRETEKINAFGT